MSHQQTNQPGDESKESKETKAFKDSIRNFTTSVDSLSMSLKPVMSLMNKELSISSKEVGKFVDQHAKETTEDKSARTKTVTIDGKLVAKLLKLKNTIERNWKSYHLIHRSFLISLISQHDALIGSLVKQIYIQNPGKLDQPEKQFSYKDLLNIGSIEDAKNQVIEKKVDDLVRKSHEEQLEWIASDLKLDAKKFIPQIPDFVEIAQRRHLFVHCDGKVSSQYLTKCLSAGYQVKDDITIGHQMEVSKDYLERSFEIVYSVGVKLGIAIWLNIRKQDYEAADKFASELSFDLILNDKYDLAIQILEFALSPHRKQFSESTRRRQILNLAQAYKWKGDHKKCSEILDEYDWKASSDSLRLGESVLRDNFQSAYNFVRKLSHDPEFKKESYYEWPIFRLLRKEKEFAEVFADSYGEPFQMSITSDAGSKSSAAEPPAPKTPAPKTPAPKTPAPKTPAPKTPAPKTPAPKTPAPPK
jgi:hypothetical protein